MSLRRRLRDPGPLLVTTVLLALLALGLARAGAVPLEDRGHAAPVLALMARSLLWAGLAWWVGLGLQRSRPDVPWLLPLAFCLGLGTGTLSGLVLLFSSSWVPATAPLMPDPGALSSGWLLVLGVVALFLAPLAEEWLFRGALFSRLEAIHGTGVAIVASAAAFALFHLSPAHVVVAGLAGLALGWLRGRSERLWPCILAHGLHNALWLAGGWLAPGAGG